MTIPGVACLPAPGRALPYAGLDQGSGVPLPAVQETRALKRSTASVMQFNVERLIPVFGFYFFYARCTHAGGTPEVLGRQGWWRLKVRCNKAAEAASS